MDRFDEFQEIIIKITQEQKEKDSIDNSTTTTIRNRLKPTHVTDNNNSLSTVFSFCKGFLSECTLTVSVPLY